MIEDEKIHAGGEVIGMMVAVLGAMIAYTCHGDPVRAAKITKHVKKELDGAVSDKIEEIIDNIRAGQRYAR